MNNRNPDTTMRQIQTMRTALETAGHSTMEAMNALKLERQRVSQLITALDQAITRAEEAETENLRLRKLVGGMRVQNDSLTRELRDLLRDVRAGSPIAKLPGGLKGEARGQREAA